MWTCDTKFIRTIICILIISFFLILHPTTIFILVQSCDENNLVKWKLKGFELEKSCLKSAPDDAGRNMFDQHLHCIICTGRLISWVTVALTAFELKVISQLHEQTFGYCFSVC